jgi:hypothetical protein
MVVTGADVSVVALITKQAAMPFVEHVVVFAGQKYVVPLPEVQLRWPGGTVGGGAVGIAVSVAAGRLHAGPVSLQVSFAEHAKYDVDPLFGCVKLHRI